MIEASQHRQSSAATHHAPRLIADVLVEAAQVAQLFFGLRLERDHVVLQRQADRGGAPVGVPVYVFKIPLTSTVSRPCSSETRE